MLRSLRVKNLALIDDLCWEPGGGFNIITGETGAGKSILIDGLNLLIGERADRAMIRSGEESCLVEAEIELSAGSLAQEVNALLEEVGAEPCEENALLLKRVLSALGANRQFANGSPVTLAALKRLGDRLVDVHGPHDHQSLLHPERQMAILDAYAKLDGLRGEFEEVFDELRRLAARREALQISEDERARRIDLLKYQAEEIESANLQAGEDEVVEREFRIAHGAREILDHAAGVERIVNGEADDAVLARLAQVERLLAAWERIDPGVGRAVELNRTAITHLQELAGEVREAAGRVDADPQRLAELEERVGVLHRLKRKYGPLLEDVIRRGGELRAELDALASSADELARIDADERRATAAAREAASRLTAARRKTAAPLAKEIQAALRRLGFAKGQFHIEIRPAAEWHRRGADSVEFIFAPNPGEEPRPLRAIASSGEIARVMLAVKTTLAKVDEVPILIFDEVDANVGGETAAEVGRSLRQLGSSHQVLCITHLPQVAAQGNAHFAVAKQTKAGRTTTQLSELEGATRVQELARMLGGQNPQTVALAKALLRGG